MVVDSPNGEWVMKLGPVTRTNHAGTREQAEEGALQQIQEAVQKIMEAAKPLIPLLQVGAVCPGQCAPKPVDEFPRPMVVSYALNDGKWFSIATSGNFGVKLACKE